MAFFFLFFSLLCMVHTSLQAHILYLSRTFSDTLARARTHTSSHDYCSDVTIKTKTCVFDFEDF